MAGNQKDREFEMEGMKKDDCNVDNSQVQTTIQMEPDFETSEVTREKVELEDGTEDDKITGNCCTNGIQRISNARSSFCKTNSEYLWIILRILLVSCWVAYFIGSMHYSFKDGFDKRNEPAIRLVALHLVAMSYFFYWAVKRYFGPEISKKYLKPVAEAVTQFYNRHWGILRWIAAIVLVIVLALILGLDVGMKKPSNLISLVGMATYILLFYIFSKHPNQVRWRPVIWGLVLQLIFAYLIMRTCAGYLVFKWLGDRVEEFLGHADAGSSFVFGEKYTSHFVAFKVLPVVVFFSTIISMLYYLGVMQIIIRKVAWIMQASMGTTAGESLNAAGNIFVGLVEAPIMIKPLLADMTNSELHAVMAGGFSTIAGSVLATYILFGVSANHLLSASVMSAPAALAMSKLFYPETKQSKTTVRDIQRMEASKDRNIIEAASSGASTSIKLVANIAANLIAFLALLQFINETLKWLGARVGLAPPGYPDFTFQFVCSYIFYPFAWVMGAPLDDCRQVASLIGVKVFTNEFIAYSDLSNLIKNRATITGWGDHFMFIEGSNCYIRSNETFTTGVECLSTISMRGEIIATYALCGFADLASIGIMMGSLGALCPERKWDMAGIVVRAMITGNVACFMTACIAGLLTVPEPWALDVMTCGEW